MTDSSQSGKNEAIHKCININTFDYFLRATPFKNYHRKQDDPSINYFGNFGLNIEMKINLIQYSKDSPIKMNNSKKSDHRCHIDVINMGICFMRIIVTSCRCKKMNCKKYFSTKA